ncbi:MAG: 4Fe-4S dicluster domain-containing protein [Desulfatibacillaceae bacterium]|nr:4Fe-4S dicluster domain-containing protein [Desulfatibacillaceae bacterium]
MEHFENPLNPALLDRSFSLDRPFMQDACQTCAACSSTCPVTGVDGFDPRKLVRLVSMGCQDEAAQSRWPWICTLCAKCESVCPMEVKISSLVRSIRSLRPRDEVPGILHKGLAMALETGNNLGIPDEDFAFIVEDVAAELREEPGYEDFTAPVDKAGANIMVTIHNKLVNTHTDDLKHWWKIFHKAGEDWTIPASNWEGVNWGLFTGDDAAQKVLVGRIVENMERLGAKTLMWPE